MASSNTPAQDNNERMHEEEDDEEMIEECDEDNTDEDVGTPPPASGNSGKRKEKDNAGVSGSGLGSRKKPRSWVWKHYTRKEDNYDICNCNYCAKPMGCRTTSGTSNLKKHILSCKGFSAWKATNKGKNQTVLSNEEDGSLGICKVSDKIVRDATNELIVLAELPLAFVESLGWRHFCSRVKLPHPVSRRTCTRDVVEMFVARKEKIKNILRQNKQRMSLTTDIWVAPHTSASYMVITAHFVDSSWKLRKFLLGFKNIPDHKGATISKVLLDCLAEWEIKKVFCITVDNATANSSAMRKFKEGFSRVGDDALVLKGIYMHLRCSTHILNLIVKEGILEIDESIESVRNGIQYVRSSSNRLKAFEFRVESGKVTRGSLPLDVKTRWNSTYLMLDQAMKFRDAFDKMEAEDRPYNDYFLESVNGKKRAGPPFEADWEEIQRLHHFLVIFYNSTLSLSASTSVTAHKIYAEIVTITRNISAISNFEGPDEELRYKALAMMTKLKKYWNPFCEETSETGNSQNREMNKLMIVASVFDPRKKMNFAELCFEKLYGKGSIEHKLLSESVTKSLKDLLDEYSLINKNASGASYSQTQGTSSQDQCRDEVVERSVLANGIGYERMDSLYDELVRESGIPETINELEMYLKEPIERPKLMKGTEYDVLDWWRRNSPKYPVLSLIARDILAMQVSSVASESAFSTSGRVLDSSRSCLTPYMIEVLMCTEQWLKCEIHINEKGFVTIQQLLSEVEDQDELLREFEPEFNYH